MLSQEFLEKLRQQQRLERTLEKESCGRAGGTVTSSTMLTQQFPGMNHLISFHYQIYAQMEPFYANKSNL